MLGYLGFCNPVEKCRCPQDGNKVLLLRRAGICSFSLAAQFSRPLETDRLSSARGRSRAPSLRLHALRLCNKSSHELGIYARCRRIFLFDQPLSIPRQPFRCHREVARPIHGDLATQGDKRRNRRPTGPGGFKACRVWVGFFLQQLIKAFSIVGLLGYFASFLFVFGSSLPKSAWIYFFICVCSLGVSAAFAGEVKDRQRRAGGRRCRFTPTPT